MAMPHPHHVRTPGTVQRARLPVWAAELVTPRPSRVQIALKASERLWLFATKSWSGSMQLAGLLTDEQSLTCSRCNVRGFQERANEFCVLDNSASGELCVRKRSHAKRDAVRIRPRFSPDRQPRPKFVPRPFADSHCGCSNHVTVHYQNLPTSSIRTVLAHHGRTSDPRWPKKSVSCSAGSTHGNGSTPSSAIQVVMLNRL